MVETDNTLYIANAWKNLVTHTACQQLENQGWQVDGNWLNGKKIDPIYKIILAAPAYFDGAIIVNPKDFPNSRIFSHLLYPDELIGWNFATNTYRYEKQEDFIPLLAQSPVLSNSQYTLDLAVSTYGEFLNIARDITYLPIEFYNIQKAKSENKSGKDTKTKVLWNHMWRSDKGVIDALTIIDQLSSRYRNVEFWVGRENSWGGNSDVDLIKEKAEEPILKLKAKNNVFFQPRFTYMMTADYWRFLTQFDIGFSVSHHEGFGLSMLEQAAAGIACVMPPREAYPEIHQEGLFTLNIAEGISDLIENPLKQKDVSQRGAQNASRFNAEDWTKRILEKIS